MAENTAGQKTIQYFNNPQPCLSLKKGAVEIYFLVLRTTDMAKMMLDHKTIQYPYQYQTLATSCIKSVFCFDETDLCFEIFFYRPVSFTWLICILDEDHTAFIFVFH